MKNGDARYAARSALGSRLRQLRAARNLSQEALARRAGMDRSFYSNIETGAVSPRVDRLWDIAAALHVPITAIGTHERRAAFCNPCTKPPERQE